MRFCAAIFIAVAAASFTSIQSHAAEFPFSVDAKLYYQGVLPTDGKYTAQNFFVTGTPSGFAPKALNIHVDLSTGSGTPVIKQVICGVGEPQPGWTATYRARSCDWFYDIAVPPGKKLFASLSTSFDPVAYGSSPSTFPVITEPVIAFPGKTPEQCQPPTRSPKYPSSSKSSVSVNVYQLPGALRPDGTLDQTKICIVATPHEQAVTGLRLWGTLHARDGHKDTYVGSYMCNITNAPDITPAEKTVVCAPKGNNNAPDVMYVPKGARLYVATTVTFGQTKSNSLKAVPVLSYGPTAPTLK